MTISVSSQTFYPKKIVCGSDTVIAITYPQLVKIGRCINEWRHNKELVASLSSEIALCDSTITSLREVSIRKDSLSLMYRREFELADNNYKTMMSVCKRNKRRSVFYVILSGIAGFVLGRFILN